MANTLFTGSSRFSTDFTQIIDRSVAIASLPLKQMQQQRIRSNDESVALKTVEAKVIALQASLIGIGGTLDSQSWKVASSDTAIRPSITDGAAEGTYTLQVNKLGVFSTAVSTVDADPLKKVSDPAASDFLTTGSTQLTLTLKDWDTGVTSVLDPATISGTSLQDTVNIINQKFGTKVKAAIVNLGTTDSPNYQLSLQSVSLGKVAIQVNDGTKDLMNVNLASNTDASLGELAEYKINGTTLKSNTRTLTIAPKVTVELLTAKPAQDITITVSRNATAFKTSLTNFINSFNTLLSELDLQSNGTLQGNSILSTIRQQLRTAVNSSGTEGFGSMANVGLEFTKEGTLSLNSTLFDTATAGKLDRLKTAIGSATTSGFLKSASDALNAIEGSKDNGILQATIKTIADSVKLQDDRIENQQLRIDNLTRDLETRMAAADALIAQLEQQATYFTNMFESMRANTNSYS
jgi:flagellar hook-associated protein 2